MAITRHVYAYFENKTTKAGQTGLTDVTFTVKSVAHSNSAIAVVVNGVTGFEVGLGVYAVQVANMAPTTYDYIGYAVTASADVSSNAAPALRWDAAEAHLTEFAYLDAAISSVAAAVWNVLTSTLTGAGTIGKALADLTASGVATAASIWAYATRTLTSTTAQTAAAQAGSDLAITKYLGYSATLTGVTIPADWTAIVLTAETNLTPDDSAALLQVRESNPGVAGDGAIYVSGAAAGALASGASLTVDQPNGTIVITLTASLTSALTACRATYDIKILSASAEPTKPVSSAAFVVSPTETKAIT